MRSDLKNAPAAPSPSTSSRDLASACSASQDGSCFKENININKSEIPKLAVEPLQMKKKKRGGGYNLRKSLAWDRAFFTEEGVLDPLELSLITGASCGDGLHFISEDTPLKKNRLEDLPDGNLSTDRRKNFLSSPDSSFSKPIVLTSPSSNQVSARAASKSGSRCGDCPRPLPTSSLKRPAHVNVGKAAAKNLKLLNVPGSKAVLSPLCTTTNSNIPRAKTLKRPENANRTARESNLPKVPVSKTDPSPVCATTRSTILRANIVKHNQIAQPDFNTQRNAGLRSPSGSPKEIQNLTKTSSLVSDQYAEKNSGKTSLKRYSSVNARPVLVDKAEISGPSSVSASLSDRAMQPSQNQTVKPSGLRKPSPSLSYFSQPKASDSYKLSSRNTDTGVCGSQRPVNLIPQENLRRAPKVDNIPDNTSTCSHVNTGSRDVINSNLEVNSRQKVGSKLVYDAFHSDPIGNKLFKGSSNIFDGNDQDPTKKSWNRRISREEAKLQKIDNEIPSQSGSCEQMTDDKSYPVNCDSCEGGWNDLQIKSKQNYTLHESDFTTAINEPRKEQTISNMSILNQGAITRIRCDVFGYRRQDSLTNQSVSEKTCKPDFCEAGSKGTDVFIYSPGTADKKTHNDLDVKTDTLFAVETQAQDALCASIIDRCKSNINLISEVGDEEKQRGKDLEVVGVCLKGEAELLGNVELSTTDRLLPDKQICILKSQEELFLEKPQSVVLDRKSGNGPTDTKIPSKELCSFDNLLSSESHNNLINMAFSNDDIDRASFDASSSDTMTSMAAVDERWKDDNNLRSNEPITDPANKNLSISPYQDTPTMGIDYCSSLPVLGKVTDMGPVLENGCVNNLLTTMMPPKEDGTNMDNLSNMGDSETLLRHSPQSNVLDECCFKQSECLTFSDDQIVVEDIIGTNDGLHHENYLETESSVLEESYLENALVNLEYSVTNKTRIHVGSLTDSSASAPDSPLKHEHCNDAYGIDDHSRVEHFSETTYCEVPEDTSLVGELLNNDSVEVASSQNIKDEDSLYEKSRTLVIPTNTIPFSDEWLAAMEAAGEDILTKKSGAVQNSPTEKSLPEPSPWSPVKKKNNQIGPFDCTKNTKILPSDSN